VCVCVGVRVGGVGVCWLGRLGKVGVGDWGRVIGGCGEEVGGFNLSGLLAPNPSPHPNPPRTTNPPHLLIRVPSAPHVQHHQYERGSGQVEGVAKAGGDGGEEQSSKQQHVDVAFWFRGFGWDWGVESF